MSSLFGVPVDAAYHLVSALSSAFAPLPGGLAAVAAIIVFTVAVRLLMLPLSYYAFRGEKARARLAPRVQELHRNHAHQPQRLQSELSALYQAEGSGMFAGCLPALLQIPFFSAQGAVFVILFVLLGVVAVFSVRAAQASAPPGSALQPGGTAQPGGTGRSGGAGQSEKLVAALGRFMPFGTLLMAAVVPLAAGIYLLTTTAWTVTERTVLRRRLRP